jgi:hypothetical protein
LILLEQLSRSTVVAVKSKALGKDLRTPCGNFAVRGFAYDIMIGGLQTIFDELYNFGPGTVNIFRKMVASIRDRRKTET